jgi:single-strand DNA-binding protein
MNTVNIIGTITRDIELKYIPSGSAIANFSIAVNQDYKKQDGTKVEKTSFFDISVFGKQAEVINQYFHKGSRIGIQGELEQQVWQDTQTQQNRSKVIIKLQKFDFIDRKTDNQQAPQQQQGYQNGSYNQQPVQPQYQVPIQQQPQMSVNNNDEIPF